MNKTNRNKYFIVALTLLFISSGLSAGTFGIDGPYVIYQPDGKTRILSVDKKGEIIDTTYSVLPENFTLHIVDHKGRFPFDVQLHPVKRPDWQYRQPEKVFVMSDPHGRLDCVISLLRGNGIIDKNFHWSFGTNHLMVIGDIFDRGNDVLQIFWLFYKPEDEAAKAGGTVSFLLGNHEPLVMANDLRYTKEKYKVLAQELGVDYPTLFAPKLPAVIQANYAEIPFTMNLEGEFLTVLTFLYDFSRMDRIVNITDVSVASPKMVDEKREIMHISVKCSGSTYRSLTDAEIAAQAAPKK